MTREHRSFAEFWPHYLREHSRPQTRALHYVGTSLVVGLVLFALVTGRWLLLALLPVVGYLFAWIGHFGVEKNRPATFTHPVYSFMGDWVMFKDILTGRIRL